MDTANNENAQESLDAIEGVMAQTRKAIASTYANPLLILWGIISVVSFTLSHFYLKYVYYIFTSFDIIGAVGTFIIFRFIHTRPPVRTQISQREGWRVLWLWALLPVYAFIWLSISAPYSGLQLNAVFSTAAMFGYIVMGLWFGSYFMVWLGLAVTATTLIGFYFIPHYYCLWMAFMCGGVTLCTGLYIRLRWR